MSEPVWGLFGFILGAIVAGFVLLRYFTGKLKAETNERQALQLTCAASRDQMSGLDRDLAVERQKFLDAHHKAEELKLERERLTTQIGGLLSDLEKERTRSAATDRELQTHQENLVNLENKWQKDFQKFLNNTLEETRVNFEKQAKLTTEEKQVAIEKTMKDMVEPLTKLVADYEKKIVEIDKQDIERDAVMKAAIDNLVLSKNELVATLRTNKGVGDWGELEMLRLLEFAGLRDGIDFKTQQAVQGGRTDVHIFLPPGDRTIVIDCKTLQLRVDDVVAAEETPFMIEERQKRMLGSFRDAIKLLHSKDYQSQLPNTTDFVILYVPRESMLAAALSADPTLCEHAASKQIVLAGPFNLIPLLKIVNMGWRQAELSKDAQEILKLGKQLHHLAYEMNADFKKMGLALEKVAQHYESASNRLKGPRGMTRQIEKLEERGAQSKERIAHLGEPPDLGHLLSAENQLEPESLVTIEALESAYEVQV